MSETTPEVHSAPVLSEDTIIRRAINIATLKNFERLLSLCPNCRHIQRRDWWHRPEEHHIEKAVEAIVLQDARPYLGSTTKEKVEAWLMTTSTLELECQLRIILTNITLFAHEE
jgi:hypothetical protein